MGRINKKTASSLGDKTRVRKEQPLRYQGKPELSKVAKKKAKKTARTTNIVARPMADRWEKKMHREIRRQGLLAALEEESRARKEASAARRRRARPVIGDLNPLVDSLEAIGQAAEAEEEEKKRKASEKRKKQKGTAKEKRRKKDFLDNVKVLQSVMQHEDFVKDPLGAVSTHVRNKLEAQEL